MSNTERTKEMTGKISANLLVATPKRHKTEIKHLTAHLAQTEALPQITSRGIHRVPC
jgi:hypothetical protein